MKRMILSLALMMSMTMAFAENEENETVNVETYRFDVNMDRLSYTLGLSSDQRIFVADFMDAFSLDMVYAACADKEDRKALVDMAIKRNLGAARSMLTKKQYHKYLMLLNATINNRGLNK
ncbi:MAG: hypothetical protein II674_00755 [Prevotella sp.]|nr:hypothetical protein [Prevotella sp.]MBQ4293974.1 hypothetical protein [Prevotella sp.]